MKKLFMLMLLALFSIQSSRAQCPPNPTTCQTTRIRFATNAGWTAVPAGIFAIGPNGAWGTGTPALQANLSGRANWIAPTAGSTLGGPVGIFSYSRTFCVCVAGTFNVLGLLNADNLGQLDIDATTIIGNVTSNNWANVDSFNGNVFLGVGLHNITVRVNNVGGPVGIIAAGSIVATGNARLCCEPGAGISGIKYNDINNNGVIDPLDPQLPGWTFTLTHTDGTVYTAVTNAMGQYTFTGLPTGTYTLTETMQNGWMAVSPAGGTITINYSEGDVTTINFLNKPIPDARGCCDDINSPNLVLNGSFEGGNMNFTTGSYIFQPSIGPGSVHEGRYSVVTGTQAGTISNCWNIPDHTSCTQAGRFLAVNGRTHNPMISMVYQQSNIQLIPGQEYIFCMYYRPLPQCEFDIFDENKMTVFIDGANNITPTDCPEVNPCGWRKRSFSFTATNPIANLSIFMDEGGIGDGNDVAFDDFSIRRKAITPPNLCQFNINTDGGSTKTITATAVTTLPAGFSAEWIVDEIQCGTTNVIASTTMSDPSWNPNSTNFPGYCCVMSSSTPGMFFTNRCYRIRRRVTSCCYVPCEDPLWISWQQPMMVGGDDGEPAAGPKGNGNDFYISKDGVNWTRMDSDGELKAATDDITIYPNPGDGNVVIKSAHSLQNTSLTIYSSDSKVVLKQRIDGNKGDVNISKLPGGVYSFEIIEPDGTRTYKKYVKQ